jgi:hypothetical protein
VLKIQLNITLTLEDANMKKWIFGIALTLLASLLIGASSGGFVNDPTVWNDPNWTGMNGTSLCPFCGMGPFNFTNIFNPTTPAYSPTTPASEPAMEPEKPVPIVLPTPVPSAKGDIASLIESLSKQKQTPFPTSNLKNLYF